MRRINRLNRKISVVGVWQSLLQTSPIDTIQSRRKCDECPYGQHSISSEEIPYSERTYWCTRFQPERGFDSPPPAPSDTNQAARVYAWYDNERCWLPGRAFSVKGLGLGLIAAVILAVIRGPYWGAWPGRLEILAWFFFVPAVAAYLAMNFTGSSTYTSLSGVKRELKWAVPLEIAGCVVGLSLWLGSRFTA